MRVLGALVLDTFREAVARWIFIGLFGLSTLLILFFLFILKIDLVEGAIGTVSLFGQTMPRQRNINEIVMNVYGGIAAFLYTWAMGLAVFASAGLIPRVLEPGRIELILSKPVARHTILIGRYIGNLLVVAANICYLTLGIWTIMGLKTGIWKSSFLSAIPLSLFTFSVLLTVVVLLGVLVESTALSTMVTTGMMIVSPILAQTELMNRLLSSELSRNIWRALYHIFPKVFDIGRITLDIVRSNPIDNWLPLVSSAIFGAVVFGGALTIFSRRNF